VPNVPSSATGFVLNALSRPSITADGLELARCCFDLLLARTLPYTAPHSAIVVSLLLTAELTNPSLTEKHTKTIILSVSNQSYIMAFTSASSKSSIIVSMTSLNVLSDL
jgi:hypothetical protein